MNKLLAIFLLTSSFTVLANPINLLGCRSESNFAHIRILKGNILDLALTSGSFENGTESSSNYSLTLDEEQRNMVASGSFTLDLTGHRNQQVTLLVSDDSEAQVIGDGIPELMKCRRLSDGELFGY